MELCAPSCPEDGVGGIAHILNHPEATQPQQASKTPLKAPVAFKGLRLSVFWFNIGPGDPRSVKSTDEKSADNDAQSVTALYIYMIIQ